MTSITPARQEVQKLIDTAKEHSHRQQRDAHKLWRAAADRSRELLGPTHEATMFCQNNVGKALVDIGLNDEAIPLLETALRQAQAIYGYVHFAVEHICQSLARAHRAKGNLSAAHSYWMTAATSSESLRGLKHNTTIYCLHQAARALASDKRFADALPLFQKTHQANLELHGQTVNTAFAARDLATCYNQLERYSDAMPHWRRAHRIFEKLADKKEITSSTFRCMMWTRDKIRAAHKLEQSQMLAAAEGVHELDRTYLVGLHLTNNQLKAVLEHLKATFLTGDDGEYPYADNLRVALKSRPKQVADYQARAKDGCCGAEDVELEVEEKNGAKEIVMVGFNFGH